MSDRVKWTGDYFGTNFNDQIKLLHCPDESRVTPLLQKRNKMINVMMLM
jgi:hypothetical protein